jgi:hypothetical protein
LLPERPHLAHYGAAIFVIKPTLRLIEIVKNHRGNSAVKIPARLKNHDSVPYLAFRGRHRKHVDNIPDTAPNYITEPTACHISIKGVDGGLRRKKKTVGKLAIINL